jgi:hypothetical protein
MSAIQFTKASRQATKLKIGVDGPSGSGKTMGALALADGITKGGRVAVADSENGSASLYADRYAFDTVALTDADPKTYRAIIDAAVAAKYDALVIDSLTHAWQHVLNAKDDYDRANPKSNSFANWRKFAPLWEDLMQHILHAPIHIIATMRSKQAYEQVEKDGRKQVVKLGLQPQVRDGAEYEFGIVFSVNQAHRAEATKDRTALFADQMIDLTDAEVHASLVGWMNAGGMEARPERASIDQIEKLRFLMSDKDAITDDVRQTVNAAIAKGLTAYKAAKWITRIEAKLDTARNGAAV